ncbi:MAG TPA: hypothetical protein VLT37_02415 [Acidocella sp.]|nr:hypothetical protein [Acidocella sp.]
MSNAIKLQRQWRFRSDARILLAPPNGIELYRRRTILYGCDEFINDCEGISSYERAREHPVLMYPPCIDGATGQFLWMQVRPLQLYQFQLRQHAPQDAKWLCQTLAREYLALGTKINMRDNGVFAIGDHGRALCN